MNTIHVNIGGIGFSLEEEGYRLLKEYLVHLEVRLHENPDRKEIISDIEARICELILDEQSPENIVSASRIKEIIGQLGLPEGTGTVASSADECAPQQSEEYPKKSLTRRLYRNPDGAIFERNRRVSQQLESVCLCIGGTSVLCGGGKSAEGVRPHVEKVIDAAGIEVFFDAFHFLRALPVLIVRLIAPRIV